MSFAIHGIGASKGIAIGRLHIVERGTAEVSERTIAPKSVEAEVVRFKKALARARAALRAVKRRIPSDAPGDISAFIDTHLLMLNDAALTSTPVKIIRDRRCNAEWALKLQRDAVVSVFDAMDDPYLRTRRDDVDHVVNRVHEHLLENPVKGRQRKVDLSGRVIFGDDLTPADTVLMQHQGVAGFITEFGGPNSHTAILARSLRIPAVVGLHHARGYLRDDETVVVDGRQGVVIGDPEPRVVRQYVARQREIERIRAARRRLRTAPAVTSDGERIGLHANIELPADLAVARDVSAAGIGLYRTEFLFMNRSETPTEDEQFEAYLDVVTALRGAPVTIRTLDLGADKQVDGVRPGAPTSSNPALGLRAVRLCLREPALFRPQLKAILRVSALGAVRMMVPMVSNLQELAQVQDMLRQCCEELTHEGRDFDSAMPVGAMIEVPAAALCADLFARHLDFMSIGTNDLIQYTMAIDRIDDEVNYLYDPLHPAVLRLIHATIKAGRTQGIPVAMCGEMAGDARYTRLLVGMGLREFSVHPNALLEIKQAITDSHAGTCRKLTERFMRVTRPSVREALMAELNRDVDLAG